jgi:hypothetical protein
MIAWLKALWLKSPTELVAELPEPLVSVLEQTPEERLLEHFKKGSDCPDCGGKMYVGPQGGMSTNIICEDCSHGFNMTVIGGNLIKVEDIGFR